MRRTKYEAEMTYKEIAVIMGISRDDVRNIEMRALRKLFRSAKMRHYLSDLKTN